jgi:fructokinase
MAEKEYDVVALGEAVIDLTQTGYSPEGNMQFEAIPAGAPCNMLAEASILGARTALNAVVGHDIFADILKTALIKSNIETAYLRKTDILPTPVTCVLIDHKGDRSFSFIQTQNSLDMLIEEYLDYGLISNCKILHIAGAMFGAQSTLATIKKVIPYARQEGISISCDVNWRPGTYDGAYAREQILPLLKMIDILKISEEEWQLFFGIDDPAFGSRQLLKEPVKLIITTLGSRGCYYHYAGGEGKCPTYDTRIINTTGAGDAFFGALHYRITKLNKKIDEIGKEEIEDIMDFANAAGALEASCKGSITAVPNLKEITECRKKVPRLFLE